MTPVSPLAPGTRLGPYTLAHALGKGSTAIVYLATRGTREVAIKVRARGDPELDRRFLREFEALRGLSLPGVVRVFDAGVGDRWLWYAMERVPGEPIRSWIDAAGDIPGRISRVLQVAPALCDAIAGIHRAGLIHRDLKPSNVLVDARGVPHVLDFGVVQWWAEGDPLTGEGGLVGTLPFMAPEQVAGSPLTTQSDLFAVGLMLYEGVIGKRPRPARPQDWLKIQCLDRPRPLVTIDPRIARTVSTVIERLTALDPHDRPDAAAASALFTACEAGAGPAEWPEAGAYVGETPVLQEAVAMLRGRGPRVMVLAGPTGSGRRRAAEQIRRRALLVGMRTVRGRCRVERPGGALQEVLDALLEAPAEEGWRVTVGGTDAPALLEMWPHLPLPSPSPGNTASARDVVRACAGALSRAADSGGLLVVFEDIDEIDRVTARVLEDLARTAPASLCVICTMDDRYASRRARRLVNALTEARLAALRDLPDLDEAEARALAGSLVPDGVSVPVAAGSPGHATAAGHSTLARLRGEPIPKVSPATFPAALTRVPLHVETWAALGLDPVELEAAGVLRSTAPRRFTFRSEALRSTALTHLASRPVASLRLAEALEQDPLASRHAPRARALLLGDDPAAAFEPAVLAAAEAERHGRYREARDWLLLLDVLPRDRETPTYARLRFPLAWCRAAVAAHTGSERPRTDLVAHAAQRAVSTEERGQAALLHVDLTRRQGDLRGALVTCLKLAGRTLPDGTPHPASVEALIRAAHMRLELGEIDDATAHLERAEEQRGGWRGDVTQVGIDQLRADASLAVGDLQDCMRLCDRGLRLATGLGFDRGAARMHQSLALAYFYMGDRPRSEVHGAAARRILVAAGDRAGASEAALHLGILSQGRGDPAAARIFLQEAITTARRLNLVRLRVHALALAVEIATVRDDPAAAAAAIQEYGTLGASSGAFAVAELRWWRSRGEYTRALTAGGSVASGGYRTAELELELARVELVLGNHAGAHDRLRSAQDITDHGHYRELALYLRVLRGAADPLGDDGWAQTLAEATQSRWVDLFLYVLLVDAHRRTLRKDVLGARNRWLELAARAEEHGHLPFIGTAQQALGTS